jgi:phosphoglycerol transferase MdoB-like AlkP superfamily enzyme
MKKILSAILLISFLVLPVFVLADTVADTAAETTVTDPGGGPPADLDVITVLGGLVNWMFYILMIVAALFLVFAGFTYLTASGDPDKVKSAHQSVMWALVGVAVAVMSRGLVALVEKILGVGGA